MIDLSEWTYRNTRTYNSSTCHWYKHFDTDHECQCNQKGGVQIVIWQYDFDGHRSYQIDITAECLTLGKNYGDWVELSFYSLSEIDQRHIDALLVAWEALNKEKP